MRADHPAGAVAAAGPAPVRGQRAPTVAGDRPHGRTRGRTIAGRRRLTGIMMTAPALVALAATALFPLLWTVSLSLQSFSVAVGGPEPGFVGLANYGRVLANPAFWTALGQTLAYVVVTLVVELAVGLAVALALAKETAGRKALRVVVALPLMIAPVVAAMAWKFLFSPGYGLVNEGLARLGIEGPAWLADPWLARATILVTNAWIALPFVILVLLAGLANIPGELNEAARVDGAGHWRRLWHITLPLLRPAILIILVIRLADAFRVFDAVYVITGGGPGDATEVLSTFLYRQMFTSADFAGGAATSVLFVVVIALTAGAVFAVLRQREDRR
ncbi:carbohydrate ABC transporter permease [Puerhibacterium puerhi]|uniref:carbohydrate ABC transporter permease n=1 Tax=Puerhibacterium puerhi TaxID=2692623 RepID=UPI00135C334A|nr:sugar ABC transporter permease [Puerhibacterium puerhi]